MTHRSPRLREARFGGRRKVGVGGYGSWEPRACPWGSIFPEWVELEVASTPPSISSLQDEVYKPATLSNGMQIQVPQFIKGGDRVRVNVMSKKYIERGKRS